MIPHENIIAARERFAAAPAVPFFVEHVSVPPAKATARTCTLRWYWEEGKYLTANRGMFVKTGEHTVLIDLYLQAWSYNLETFFLHCKLTPRLGDTAMVCVTKPCVFTCLDSKP